MLMRSAFGLTFIVIVSCVYAGLAVLGWGGFRPFFSHAALTALVMVLFALSVVSFFAGGNLSPGVREARSNRWVIAVFGVIGFLLTQRSRRDTERENHGLHRYHEWRAKRFGVRRCCAALDPLSQRMERSTEQIRIGQNAQD